MEGEDRPAQGKENAAASNGSHTIGMVVRDLCWLGYMHVGGDSFACSSYGRLAPRKTNRRALKVN
jgi:hypothetical protein